MAGQGGRRGRGGPRQRQRERLLWRGVWWGVGMMGQQLVGSFPRSLACLHLHLPLALLGWLLPGRT